MKRSKNKNSKIKLKSNIVYGDRYSLKMKLEEMINVGKNIASVIPTEFDSLYIGGLYSAVTPKNKSICYILL